jgi:hypothetical protein
MDKSYITLEYRKNQSEMAKDIIGIINHGFYRNRQT